MKPAYFDQETADLDDKLLTDAIAQGRVPKTCLWGGVMVQEVARVGLDPCTRCPCPRREACGGRPMVEQFEVGADIGQDAKMVFNNESGARKLLRRSWAKDILRAGHEAQKKGQ